MDKSIGAVVGVIVAVVLAAVGVITARTLTDVDKPRGCVHRDIAPLKADAGVIELAPRTPDRVMTLLFGESRDAQVVTADFQSSDPLPIARDTLISVDVGDFTRSDGFRFPTAPFNVAAGEPEPISTYAFVTGRTSIRLWMCFDPAGPQGRAIRPGTETDRFRRQRPTRPSWCRPPRRDVYKQAKNHASQPRNR